MSFGADTKYGNNGGTSYRRGGRNDMIIYMILPYLCNLASQSDRVDYTCLEWNPSLLSNGGISEEIRFVIIALFEIRVLLNTGKPALF